MALKRSHSPEDIPRDDGAQAAPKRARSGEDDRPPLADAYLEGLPRADLVQLLKQVEQLVHQTPQAADVRALLYPQDLESRVQREEAEAEAEAHAADTSAAADVAAAGPSSAPAAAPLPPAAPAAGPPSAPAAAPLPPAAPAPAPAAQPAPPLSEQPAPQLSQPSASLPLYTPSIPASGAAPGKPGGDTGGRLPLLGESDTTSSSPDVSALLGASRGGNVSSRIAAILDSINTSSSSGPMLGLQGQPLAPARQAAASNASTGGFSSLLSSSNLLSGQRFAGNTAISKLLDQQNALASSRPTTPTPATAPAPTAPGSPAAAPARTSTPFGFTRLGTASPGGSALDTGMFANGASSGAQGGMHDGEGAPAMREHRITSALPSYEDMIVEGLQAIGDVNGTPPRMLFHWMEDTYPLMKNFRPSASQALQKAFKRGRLLKMGSLYRINPDWDGSNTGRKPTRRPQVGKDHPMMVNGPKGPAPASPFKARAQFQGAAAYRQTASPLTKQRSTHSRLLQSLRPGPKPYGQPGAAPLDNPASGIFQNGAAAAALLLAHQQRMRGGAGNAPDTDLTPSLTSLVQQLRSNTTPGVAQEGAGSGSYSLSSTLASALLKHAQRPADGAEDASAPAEPHVSSPVLNSLSRLLGTGRLTVDAAGHLRPTMGAQTAGGAPSLPATAPSATPAATLPATGPGSLSHSIETLMRQATQTAQSAGESGVRAEGRDAAPAPQADLDAAVTQTLEAAFQQIGPSQPAGGRPAAAGEAAPEPAASSEAPELSGINLADYSDALRTLSAALSGGQEGEEEDENARHLADERAIAEAEADHASGDEGGEEAGAGSPEAGAEGGGNRMSSLLKSYGIDVSGDELRRLTETLREPNAVVSSLSGGEKPAEPSAAEPTERAAEPAAPAEPPVESQAAWPGAAHGTELSALLSGAKEQTGDAGAPQDTSAATSQQAIQSQLEALIASLASGGGEEEEEEGAAE